MTSQHGAQESQTLGALVHQLSQQIPELVRSEIRLAQAEVAEKGKRAGVGIGMFSVAGLMGKNKVAEAGPPAPERAIRGIKEDIATVKGDHHG
jgi:hypothetical protein